MGINEYLVALCFWLIVLIPVGVFVRQWLLVRRGVRRKARATVLFCGYSVLPVLAYVAVFFALAGIEELTKTPIIGDGMARTLLLVVGIGLLEVLLLTGLFAIVMSFLQPRDKS